METSLKGKTAIITGSTSGIGYGIAERLAAHGAKIMLNGLGDAERIENTRKTMADTFSTDVFYNGADMTKPDQIKALVDETYQKAGSVDIIVNNAGIQHVEKMEDFPDAKWDAIIAIVLSSSFHMSKHSIPLMRKRKWGRIINLASAHALVASPFKSAYVAAKHGMAGLTKVTALEVAQDNITCNAICPGYVKTPLVENQISDTAKARGISEDAVVKDILLAAQPTKKFTEVEHIGDMAVLLCSESGCNVNGAILPIDGGWTAQ